MSPRIIEHELSDNIVVALLKYAKYILWVHYRGVVAETEQRSRQWAVEHKAGE